MIVNKKIKNHSINGINFNGVWNEDLNEIQEAARNHFANRFKELNSNRPLFHSNLFMKLDNSDVSFLESEFTLEEVKEAVWDCSSSKSLGPDGLNFKFIKRYSSIIRFEFFNFIKYFEKFGCLARGCNASFIVLIPKNSDPVDLGDYRLISLIGCMYKVLSKLLSRRLCKVIYKLITPNQSAFFFFRKTNLGW